jgi:hypothetical protein
MLENITSGDDYAKILIESVVESEIDIPTSERMDPDLFIIWKKIIYKESNSKWQDYIIGKNDSYLFSDIEFTETFQKAAQELVSNTLSGLFDKEMVKMSVGDDGEILYSLTEEGKKQAEIISKNQK